MRLPASNPEGLIMKNSLIGLLVVWMVGVWSAPALASGLYEQVIRLQPGWNAVYLDVQPEMADADRVFAGIPVQSAWVWDRPGQGVQFVDDPNKLAPGKPEWLTYYPPGSANAALKNLYEIEGGRPLLVQVATNRAVDWRVVGAPARWRARWVDNSLNLVGFPLASSSTNTFRTLLGGDSAFSGSLTVLKLGAGGACDRTSSDQAKTGRCILESISEFGHCDLPESDKVRCLQLLALPRAAPQSRKPRLSHAGARRKGDTDQDCVSAT